MISVLLFFVLASLVLFPISEHFPRLIEVNSEGKNGIDPSFDPEFSTRGMFRINNEKIQVSYNRGMSVLDYDLETGTSSFAVCLNLFFFCKAATFKNRSFVVFKSQSKYLRARVCL